MATGARSPEELETLLEDAFVLGDAAALARLFNAGGVLAPGGGLPAARGNAEIGRVGWLSERRYLAEPLQVIMVRDVALVIGRSGLTVTRRGDDGTWRYLIAVLQSRPEGERDGNAGGVVVAGSSPGG